ncbi:MAG: hypothetical protein WBC44_02645 [Planctomycetaceae bacterium]
MEFVAQIQVAAIDTANGRVRVIAAKDNAGDDWILLHASDSADEAVCLLRLDDAEDLSGAIASAVDRLRNGHLKIQLSSGE